jgi:hypothetical protein
VLFEQEYTLYVHKYFHTQHWAQPGSGGVLCCGRSASSAMQLCIRYDDDKPLCKQCAGAL